MTDVEQGPLTPDQALTVARERVEAKRRAGAYATDLSGFLVEAPEGPTLAGLRRWSMLAPQAAEELSQRRLSGPRGALRRLVERTVAEQVAGIAGQASRFNAQLLAYVSRLEDRVSELESGIGRRSRDL